jgi:broad specificity phosphatase PhoE
MKLTLVRHGRSMGDDQDRIEGGGWDAPLTAEGQRQAELLSGRLSREEYHCDVLFASPLIRAARVAEIIAASLGGVAITFDQRLAEQHTGCLGGLTEAEAASVHSRPDGGFRSYVRIPGGESYLDQTARVLGFYAELVDRHANDRVCVVAHGGTISQMLQIIYGAPLWQPVLDRRAFRFRTGDTGVHRLTIDEGCVVTHFLNDTSHLR